MDQIWDLVDLQGPSGFEARRGHHPQSLRYPKGGPMALLKESPCRFKSGLDEDERNLRNKVSRGKFTAGFLLQCLTALGINSIQF